MTYVRQARLDKNKRLILLIFIVIFLFSLLFVYFFIDKDSKVKKEGQNDNAVAEQSVLNVVRASRNIQAGEQADVSKFEVIAVPRDLVPAGVVDSTQQLKNKRVTNIVAEKEFLLLSDLVDSTEWYEEEDRLIEHIFQDEAIPSTVVVGSVVDIKLFRPKNEDAIVIAKTVVIGKKDKTLSFYLNMAEQEHLKEANTEGLLFLVQYLDMSQSASAVTYIPMYGEKYSESRVEANQSFENSSMKKR